MYECSKNIINDIELNEHTGVQIKYTVSQMNQFWKEHNSRPKHCDFISNMFGYLNR